MPGPSLRLSADPKAPTAVDPKPADHPPAGADPEVAAGLISGMTQRVWIAEAVKAPLGGMSCEEGLRYRFRSSGTVELDSCVDGAWGLRVSRRHLQGY